MVVGGMLTLIILKAVGVIDWTWSIVLLPLWGTAVLVAAGLVFLLLCAVVMTLWDRHRRRRHGGG